MKHEFAVLGHCWTETKKECEDRRKKKSHQNQQIYNIPESYKC